MREFSLGLCRVQRSSQTSDCVSLRVSASA